jgi:hypothetical protein
LTVHSVIRLYNTKKSSASIQQAGANILFLSCTLSICRPSSWLPTHLHDLEEYSSQIVQPLYMRRKKNCLNPFSKGKRYSTLTPKSTNSCRCHAWKIIVAILSRSLLNEGRWHRFPSVCTYYVCSSMYTIMLYYIEMLHHRSIFGREKKSYFTLCRIAFKNENRFINLCHQPRPFQVHSNWNDWMHTLTCGKNFHRIPFSALQ